MHYWYSAVALTQFWEHLLSSGWDSSKRKHFLRTSFPSYFPKMDFYEEWPLSSELEHLEETSTIFKFFFPHLFLHSAGSGANLEAVRRAGRAVASFGGTQGPGKAPLIPWLVSIRVKLLSTLSRLRSAQLVTAKLQGPVLVSPFSKEWDLRTLLGPV